MFFSFFPGISHGMEDKNRQEPKDEELEKQVLATRPARPGFVAKKTGEFPRETLGFKPI